MAAPNQGDKGIDGYKFEVYVAKLYRQLGKPNVKRNVTHSIRKLLHFPGSSNRKIQIDVEYGFSIMKTRVECKYRANGLVQADVIERMHEKKALLGSGNYVVVTNAGFSNDAQLLASRYGIELVDGAALAALQDSILVSRLKKFIGIKSKPLEELVRAECQDHEHHYTKQYRLI